MIRLSWTSPPIRPSEAPGPSVMAVAAASSSTTAWPSTPRPARSSACAPGSSPASPAPRGSESPTLKRWRSRSSGLGLQGVGPAPEGTCSVDIADRGADSSRPCGTALDLGHRFLLRATQDRKYRRVPSRRTGGPPEAIGPLVARFCLQHSRGPRPRGPPARAGRGANRQQRRSGPGPGDLEGPSSRGDRSRCG